MIVNTAKQKMLAGQPAFGFSLGMGSPLVAELLSRSGIDFVLLDRQHGSWGEDSTIAALMALTAGSASPMARVARNDYTLIGRLLDEGVMGMVVPMVDTQEQAQAVADACRLPPQANVPGVGAVPRHTGLTILLGSTINFLWPCSWKVPRLLQMLKRSSVRLALMAAGLAHQICPSP